MFRCSKCDCMTSEEFSQFVQNAFGEFDVLCRDCFIQDQVTKFKKENRS